MTHLMPIRVYYEDTDAGGVVYHANYLRFAERARSEWLRDLGLSHGDLLTRFARKLVVHRCSVEFHRPARLDELLKIYTQLVEIKGAKMKLRQLVLRSELALVDLHVDLAVITPSGRPARVPDELRSLLLAAAGLAEHA